MSQNIKVGLAFAAGVSCAMVVNNISENIPEGCIFDDHDKVYVLKKNGDVSRHAMIINREAGVCEPIAFSYRSEVPIMNGKAVASTPKYRIPVGFKFGR